MFARESKRDIVDNITFVANNARDRSWEGDFRDRRGRGKVGHRILQRERHIVPH